MSERTILVVEDNDTMRHAMHDILAGAFPSSGVIATTNGKEAVVLTEKVQPDMVVMDSQLPYMDSAEAAKQIKEVNAKTKIVFISLSNNQSDQQMAKQAGADGYVQKDEGYLKLLRLVKTLL